MSRRKALNASPPQGKRPAGPERPERRYTPRALSSFSLIVTGECNFSCRYCYQEKDGLSLGAAELEKALDFFWPRFGRECAVMFCGGEPLLRQDTIRRAVGSVSAKNRHLGKAISFSISTNGSLLNDDILAFFDRHRFSVLLSFDGFAQDKGRKKGTFRPVSEALESLRERRGIELLTNSVFMPETVSDLSASIRDIVSRGVRDVQISFATEFPWRPGPLAELEAQLADLRRFLLARARRTGRVPVANFRKSPEAGLFACPAGESRMALAPDGRLWGCHLFYDFHHKTNDPYSARYGFGPLDSFMADPQRVTARVLPRYADLEMDFFHTPRRFCGLCPEVHDCVICPVDAAFSSGIIGRITTAGCRIRRIVRRQKRLLWEDLEAGGDGPLGPRVRAPRSCSEA